MGVLATAGCTQVSSSVPGLGSEGGSTDGKQLRKETIKEVSRTVTLEKDQFEAVSLSFDQRSVLLFSVVADKQVDVLTFHQKNFQKYRKDTADKLRYIGPLSEEETVATAQGSAVSAGKPVVVVDNTTWGATAPSGPVQVDLQLEAFVRKGKKPQG